MSLSNYIQQAQTKCFTKHGVFFAFSNKQFDEQKQEGVKYVSLGAGTVCPKENVKAFMAAHKNIIKGGIYKDIKENGKEAIIQRELENYECFYTGDTTDCIEALEGYGFSADDINAQFNTMRRAA